MISFELSEELSMVQRTAEDFAKDRVRPAAREAEQAQAVPEAVSASYVELGLHAADVPEAAGGLGLGLISRVVIDEAIAHGDPGVALGLPNVGAFGRFVVALGTEEQQASLLSPSAESAAVGSVCFSDLKPKPRCFTAEAKEQDDGTWLLNGAKRDVLNAGAASCHLVFVNATWRDGRRGPAAFVVDADDSVRVGAAIDALGLSAAPIHNVTFEHTKVPADRRLCGADNRFGDAVLRATAESGLIGASRSVGLAAAAFELAKDWAAERTAFGKPIAHFQGLAFLIADMATTVEVMRAMVHRAAWAVDTNQRDALGLATMAIAECHEGAMFVADNGVQVLGGSGFIRDYLAEKWMRDAKAHMAYALPHQTCDLLLGRLALDGAELSLEEDGPMADVQPVMI